MLQKDKIHLLTITALFAAAIAVMTAYLLHIPIPTGGYIHLGDALIYLAACLLPVPYAAAAAAIGAGLADLLTAPMWVLPTLVIKAVLVLFFPAAYALAGCAMTGTMAAFVPQFLGTLIQGIGSGALFIVITPALDGVKLKARVGA